MARSTFNESPEALADERMRFDKRLQDAQDRQNKISARLIHRSQALAAGIPKSFLPSVTQVKEMDDSTWNSHTDRWSRMGFHGVDAQGRLLPAPQMSPLVIPQIPREQVAKELSGKTPLRSIQEGAARSRGAAGIAPVVEVPGLGRTTIPTGPLNEFSTTPADANAIAARYGDPGTAKTTFSKAPDRVPFIAGADGKNVAADYIAGGKYSSAKVGSDPTLAPTVLQPEQADTIAAAPSRGPLAILGGIPKTPDFSAAPPAVPQFGGLRLNADLTSSDPALTRPPEPPGRAELAGQKVRRVVGNFLGAIPRDTTFGSSQVTAPATRDEPIFDIPGFTRGVLGRQTESGVSRSQVARIQQPTQENPIPVTDTTPVANIDDSKNAIQKFTDVTDWTKRKYAFAGF